MEHKELWKDIIGYELYNINYETLNHKCSFRTERGDYYNLWIEEIELE